MKLAALRGAYTAERAAALSGVPWSTVHYWARKEILVPSISASRVKLWSYTDLIGLRTIYWLRQPKVGDENWRIIPASTMPKVRRALAQLEELDLDLWTEDDRPNLLVDAGGEVYIDPPEWGPQDLAGQRLLDRFDLIAPFQTQATRAPDLHKPRPHLRIVPGKLSGSPHIAHTRIETQAVAALADRGFDTDQIERLYPKAPVVALVEAVDLERDLALSLRKAAQPVAALFALDQNFPQPIVEALNEFIPEADLVPISDVDARLAELDDWEVLLGLHHHDRPWDGIDHERWRHREASERDGSGTADEFDADHCSSGWSRPS